jgi:transcriptional regulator with XRE-family HTH domain
MSDTGPSAPLNGSERIWLREVGMRIRLARVRSGESQSELGGRSGVSRVTVGYIERGDHVAALTTYRRLAYALGVPLEDLTADAVTNQPSSSRRLRLAGDVRGTR